MMNDQQDKHPNWHIGDRVETTKPLNSIEGEVPVGTQGKLIDITSGGWRYWIEWDNGVFDNYDYFENSKGHGIIKIADAIISKMTVYQTKTLSGIAGSLDQSIADYLNDGWTVAFETTNILDDAVVYHTVRLQRESSDVTPTLPTSPIENLRQQTEALIDDVDSDDPEPPAPEPIIEEHNPALFLTAPDPVQSAINATNAKIERLLVQRYQEIANKYAGWKPTRFTMVAV
jgi:hypothetical protein